MSLTIRGLQHGVTPSLSPGLILMGLMAHKILKQPPVFEIGVDDV
jgi:hypothetical protein